MKPHISGESSLANELRRSAGEKLHQVDEGGDHERRRRRSHRVEEPIRTLMFLGSMNHT
uniref:Uncharacterized protein n=1 Tax=Phaseolus vulgaris TaxID=3885 RepID=V7BDE4_PHAVU|nr:hypothetical protein PHAVU_007G107100g [Phaseolus vulgaris]ESW15844.1 hypothetical protein PHAVU_007G107100g [Phaseolus vulgaris]